MFWLSTETCSVYLQELHLPYMICIANWRFSIVFVSISTWESLIRNFKTVAHRLRTACVHGQLCLTSALRLSSNRSDRSMIFQRQNKNPEKHRNHFSFGDVKLRLNICAILCLASRFAGSRKHSSQHSCVCFLKLTVPFWTSHLLWFFLALNIYYREFLAE